MFHQPILIDSFLSFFDKRTLRVFVDGTLGAGGHAQAILTAHPEIELFLGFDQDETALAIAAETLHPFRSKVRLCKSNFRDFSSYLEERPVDGLFFDLGVSSMQLDRPEKGFSLYREGPLDMRMDQDQSLDAERVINTFSERELGTIFRELGEEPRWRAVAREIVEKRKRKRITTTTELVEALARVLPWRGKKRIHPLTLVFQGLRIFVNDELGAIEEVIPEAISSLAPGGRLGMISFHSLEDRIVKHLFRRYATEKKEVTLLTKKPIIADREEVCRNPRSRSAKMRFVEKI